MKLWIKTYVGDKITNSIVLSKKAFRATFSMKC